MIAGNGAFDVLKSFGFESNHAEHENRPWQLFTVAKRNKLAKVADNRGIILSRMKNTQYRKYL